MESYSFRGAKDNAAQKTSADPEMSIDPVKAPIPKKASENKATDGLDANPFLDSPNTNAAEEKKAEPEPESKVDILDMIGLTKPESQKQKKKVIPASPNFVLLKKKINKSGENKLDLFQKIATMRSASAEIKEEEQKKMPDEPPKPINLTSSANNPVAIHNVSANESKLNSSVLEDEDKKLHIAEVTNDRMYNSPKLGKLCCSDRGPGGVKSMLSSCNCDIF